MNYELAKKLKDAGFPQTGMGHCIPDVVQVIRNVDGDPEFIPSMESTDNAYFPTLSELIEACGESFGALTSYKDNECVSPDWGARSNVSAMHIMGTTPEEAVANLFLALHD